jgi:YD repeat-containing protein
MQRAAATLTLFLGFSDPGGATTQHFHHLHDALNTPIATTSADGNIAQRNLYDAFGNLEAQTSPNPYLAERPSRIGFTGYQLDRETSSEP